MVDKAWVHLCRADPAYERGAWSFVRSVSAALGDTNVIVCPCIDCRNVDRHEISEVVGHLVTRGMDEVYKLQTDWYHHGDVTSGTMGEAKQHHWSDEIYDLYRAAENVDSEMVSKDHLGEIAEVEDKKEDEFLAKLRDAETPLYGSCENHSKLSAIVSLFRLKTQNGWSDKSFNDLLETLPGMLPADNVLHTSLYEVKKFLKSFDMGYEKIHACVNDCCLFRKKYKKLQNCPKCNASRWKINRQTGEIKKGVPQKVLRYFPIIPRLQRMFRSEEMAKDLRWHFNNKSSDGKLRHPVDSVTWDQMNDKYPVFAAEERNIRLGLSTDGFNPFDMKNSRYSCWPVLLVNYNLPPHLCMKKEHIMLTLLIPGPHQPGNSIDIYLEPLIDDLCHLWNKGELAYDAYSKTNFTLKAMLLWTISDFPAYGNLAGCKVKGKMGCPVCGKHTDSTWLKFCRKHVYMCHRKGLPPTHRYRDKKSRIVQKINTALINQQRMNLRPKNISPTEWRKFVKFKTSQAFKVVSDQYKKRRSMQIPHTCSRKGMVRLAEEMKEESSDPSEVTRLKVWVKSRTKKDGTPVNTNAAVKFRKAAELVDTQPESNSTNPKDDLLSQLLGTDNPGRLREIGRGMSMSKLDCFQVKNKTMAEMQEKQVLLLQTVKELREEIAEIKNKKHEPEVGENSAARTVNRGKSQPKCVLVDWAGTDENVAEGLVLSTDPADFVNDIPLGPNHVKVLVETAIKPDAYLWRPAINVFNIEQAVGLLVAWPDHKCVILDQRIDTDDIAPKSPTTNPSNKCKLLHLSKKDEVVAEGRWQSQDPKALVNGLLLGPHAVKVFVDVVIQPDTFLWRPTIETKYLVEMSFVAWPAHAVVFENTSDASGQKSALHTSTAIDQDGGAKSHATVSEVRPHKSPKKTNKQQAKSPVRRSERHNPLVVAKENQKCKLMDVTGLKRVVAEGRWASNNPDQTVHFVPLGKNAVRVWVDIVKVSNAAVWRPCSEIETMEDALGTSIAWPEDKVIMC